MDSDSKNDKIFDIVYKPSADIISGYAHLGRFFSNAPVLHLVVQDIDTKRRYEVKVSLARVVATSDRFDDFLIYGHAAEIIRISSQECYDIGTEVNCHLMYDGQGSSSLTFIPRRG